ncbi:MAG: NUDIX domain-containing protein [Maritimibacter sp.]
MRRFGDQREAKQVYTWRPGVYVLLPRSTFALLTFQKSPVPEFQLPGGGIDPGESPLQALHREVLEETGWTIANPRKHATYKRFTYMPEYEIWAEKICHLYVARPVKRVAAPSDTAHVAKWVSKMDLAQKLLNDGDRAFAQSYFN